MADLELIHIQMSAKDGDPGWHAGQLDDGRSIHAAAIPCAPGIVHWSGSVEEPNVCDGDAPATSADPSGRRSRLYPRHRLLPLRQQLPPRPLALSAKEVIVERTTVTTKA